MSEPSLRVPPLFERVRVTERGALGLLAGVEALPAWVMIRIGEDPLLDSPNYKEKPGFGVRGEAHLR